VISAKTQVIIKKRKNRKIMNPADLGALCGLLPEKLASHSAEDAPREYLYVGLRLG
jgi:hypothetical protein